MIKAKDFWSYLCNDLEYRFFSGVPNIVFKSLYKKMNNSFLHYIPAVNSEAVIGVVNGIRLTGMNSMAIMGLDDLETCLISIQRFNIEYKLPLTIISNKVDNNNFKILSEFIINYKINVVDLSKNFTEDLDSVTNFSIHNLSLLLVEEGFII